MNDLRTGVLGSVMAANLLQRGFQGAVGAAEPPARDGAERVLSMDQWQHRDRVRQWVGWCLTGVGLCLLGMRVPVHREPFTGYSIGVGWGPNVSTCLILGGGLLAGMSALGVLQMGWAYFQRYIPGGWMYRTASDGRLRHSYRGLRAAQCLAGVAGLAGLSYRIEPRFPALASIFDFIALYTGFAAALWIVLAGTATLWFWVRRAQERRDEASQQTEDPRTPPTPGVLRRLWAEGQRRRRGGLPRYRRCTVLHPHHALDRVLEARLEGAAEDGRVQRAFPHPLPMRPSGAGLYYGSYDLQYRLYTPIYDIGGFPATAQAWAKDAAERSQGNDLFLCQPLGGGVLAIQGALSRPLPANEACWHEDGAGVLGQCLSRCAPIGIRYNAAPFTHPYRI